MHKEILFLDFDGPLFPDRWISYASDNRKPYPGLEEMPEVADYWRMDPMSVEMLNFLYELHPFKTVVSSSWKRFCNRRQVEDLFAVNGLALQLFDHPMHWSTPDWKNNYEIGMYYGSNYSTGDKRAKEISMWIEEHGEVDYLILDDPMSGSSLDDTNQHELDPDRIILVDPDVGIGSYDYKRMSAVVQKWAGVKPSKPLW